MEKIRFQWLLKDNTRSKSYKMPKNVRYSDPSIQWTKLSSNVTV